LPAIIATVAVMTSVQARTFSRVRTFSSVAVAIVIALSIAFSSWLGFERLDWQVAMAVAALAIGIPHGALDHLVTLPRHKPALMAIFLALYVAIALASIAAILKWNLWGFIAVIAMSATHFGIGDSAFISELDRLQAKSGARLPIWAYASAAGLLPVVIPLVSSQSSDALAKVNPALVDWSHGLSAHIQIGVAAIAALSAITLLMRRRFRDLLDIALLAGLASFAPPLVAFAVYFGCWHAMRHTARLTSLLPASIAAYEKSDGGGAFMKAILPGLPALLGTFIFVAFLAGFARTNVDDDFLWLTLVTVWALTVPHMLVTAKLDRAALK
jgi:Brp/Blh family beta-carotene 15,15'-monooxygenase